jgi:F-box-like
MLPDDVLLAIFYLHVNEDQLTEKGIKAWQSLVHVCQRWRSLVFESPHHLNVQLLCTPARTSRGMLDVWPALPLVVMGFVSGRVLRPDLDNIIPVLELNDRVCKIDLEYDSRSKEKVWAAMQKSFPELAHLKLSGSNKRPVVPDSFLGGSAPRLRFLQLDAIPFPGLPRLLLSTTHLVTLHLSDIPHSGYFSPEAIVTALSRSTSLNMLSLGFRSLQSRPYPESRHPLSPTRTVLPALTDFDFAGASEYLEDLVARIDAPRLNNFKITLFYRFDFDTPQLAQFISRTPTLKAFDSAHVGIGDRAVKILTGWPELLIIEIFFREPDFQLSSLPWVSTSTLPSLSTVESLYICEDQYVTRVENLTTEWSNLLRPFTAVKNLYLSEIFGPGIVRALQGPVGGRTTSMLPTLQTVFLEGPQPSGLFQEDIEQFVAARQVSGRPCTTTCWGGGGRL